MLSCCIISYAASDAAAASATAAASDWAPGYIQSPYLHYGFLRVWLKHNLNSKGWNSQAHREFPRKFESSNLSRDNVSREIGRTSRGQSFDTLRANADKDRRVNCVCLLSGPRRKTASQKQEARVTSEPKGVKLLSCRSIFVQTCVTLVNWNPTGKASPWRSTVPGEPWLWDSRPYAQTSFPLSSTGPHGLGSATFAKRLTTSRHYEHHRS